MESCSYCLPKELCDVTDQAFRVVYFQNETPYLFFDSVSRSLEGGSPISLASTFPSDAFLASRKGSGSCCRSSTFRVSCINASRLVLRVVEDQA